MADHDEDAPDVDYEGEEEEDVMADDGAETPTDGYAAVRTDDDTAMDDGEQQASVNAGDERPAHGFASPPRQGPAAAAREQGQHSPPRVEDTEGLLLLTQATATHKATQPHINLPRDHEMEPAVQRNGVESVSVSIRDANNLASLSSIAAAQPPIPTNTSQELNIDTTQQGNLQNQDTHASLPHSPPMKKRVVDMEASGQFEETTPSNVEPANGELFKGDKKVEEATSREEATAENIIKSNECQHTTENPNVWSNETQRFGCGKSESNLQNDLFASKECEDMLVESSEEEEENMIESPPQPEEAVATVKLSEETQQLANADENNAKPIVDADAPAELRETGKDSSAAASKENDNKDTHVGAEECAKVDSDEWIRAKISAKPPTEGKIETSDKEPSVAAKEGALPPPTELPLAGVVCLRGMLTRSGGVLYGVDSIKGVWALGLDTILADPDNSNGLCLDFEYEHQPSVGANIPSDGKYSGWFHLNSDDGLSKLKSEEKDVMLKFIKNSDGYYNVEGSGSNVYGSYSIVGTLTSDGVITMCRKFVAAKPMPKRGKKVASPKKRSRGSISKKRSKGSPAKSGTPKKKKKVPLHRDAGKRYGIGKPGLLCDCCFFEEDGEIGQTPFIKCIYCDLVAHSACYPPMSNVDTNGKFLCDVCTTFFHPEVNRKERTKNPEDGNIPPPKPLAEDIEAKGDGRIHKAGIYCQLCARNDVLGGMKPTDSNSWVHLACLMSSDHAWYDNNTAVHVQGALKKNKTQLIKHKKETGAKAKCEECGGGSGMLLKCKEEGCKKYLHALCAEIVDRLRVVENNGVRDIISYKCTLHSYAGLDVCGVCELGTKQNEMLECDKCSQGFHMSCLSPPLTEIPESDWFCEKCSKTESDTAGGEGESTTAEKEKEPPPAGSS